MIAEFFYNVGKGIIENKDVILTAISSAEFVTLLGMIVSFFKSKKGVKDNTAATKTLNDALLTITDIDDQLKSCADSNALVISEVQNLRKEVSEVKELQSVLLSKLDSVLEVQSIVYSTSIKDANVRSTVINILTNAKHVETAQMSKLKTKLEELQAKVTEKAQSVSDEVQKAIKEADTIIDVTSNEVVRY